MLPSLASFLGLPKFCSSDAVGENFGIFGWIFFYLKGCFIHINWLLVG